MIPVDQRAWHICFSTPTAACHLANWSNWNCCVNFPWFWEEAVWSMIRPPYMVHVKALLCGQKNVSFIYGAKFYEDDVQSHADTHQCLLCGGLVALITTTSRIRWIQNGNVIGNHACFAMHKEDQRGSSDQFSQEPLREWSLTHLLALWHAPMTVLQQMVSADTWSIAQPLPPAAAAPDFLWGDWHVDPQKKWSATTAPSCTSAVQFKSLHIQDVQSILNMLNWLFIHIQSLRNTSSNLPEFRIPSSLQHGHRTQQGQGFMPLSGAAGSDHRAVMLNLWTRWKIVPSRLPNETSEMIATQKKDGRVKYP